MRPITRLGMALLTTMSIFAGNVRAAPETTWLDHLQPEIGTMLSGWSGDYAVTVTDLQTDQSISVNGTRSQTAASTIKIYIAIAIAQQIDDGRLAHADVDDLMQSMMAVSDNESAYALIELLGNGDVVAGTQAVNTVAQELGATGSALDSPPDHAEIDIGIAVDNLLTSDDMNLILTKLYHGEILTASATAYVLHLMSLPEGWQSGSVGGPLPPACHVRSQTGLDRRTLQHLE